MADGGWGTYNATKNISVDGRPGSLRRGLPGHSRQKQGDYEILFSAADSIVMTDARSTMAWLSCRPVRSGCQAVDDVVAGTVARPSKTPVAVGQSRKTRYSRRASSARQDPTTSLIQQNGDDE